MFRPAMVTLAGLAGLVACTPFGAGASADDAGTNAKADAVADAERTDAMPDAAADPSTDAAPVVPRPCSTEPSGSLCEDYEGAWPGAWVKNETNGGVVLDRASRHAGEWALKASVQKAVNGPSSATTSRPLASSPSHIRVFMRLPQSPTVAGSLKVVMLGGLDLTLKDGLLTLNQFSGGPPQFKQAPLAFPIGKWVCVEWEVASGKVWLDGDLVIDEPGDYKQASSIEVGLYYLSQLPSGHEIWLDDLRVSSTPIGCG